LTKERGKFVGSFILGKNEIKQRYDTLLVIDKTPGTYIQDVCLTKKGKYRYYCIRAPRGMRVRVAYIEFLGGYSYEHPCYSPTPLPVFSGETLSPADTFYRIGGIPVWDKDTPPELLNRNMETFEDLVSFEMDFKIPVQIECIRYAPVNANNMIVKGDRYRFSYYDMGWKDVDTSVATANYLSYDNVPTGSVYWLKNLDNGVEELSFFYQDNRQYFNVMEYLLKYK
jgi:hypothetical protein